jgi:hypothetical protein
MATGASYRPGDTAQKWVAQVYSPRFDRLCYESSKLIKRIDEEEPLRGQLHIPKFDNLNIATYADNANLYEPVFQSNTEGEITISPTYYDCNVAVDDRQLQRMIFDPKANIAESAVLALSQQADKNVAVQFGSLVSNPAGSYASNLDLPAILQARGLVLAGAKEFAEIGSIVCAYATAQDQYVMAIGPLVQWVSRGDSGNPAKTGVLGEGFGLQFVMTTNVQNNGAGGWNNSVFIKRSFVVSYNIRPSTKLQEHGNAKWILGQMDLGVAIKRDQYSSLLKAKV